MSFTSASSLVSLIIQPLPTWLPWVGEIRSVGLRCHPLFVGSGANPPFIAIRQSLPGAGCPTSTFQLCNGDAERGDARRTAPKVGQGKGKGRMGIGGRRNAPRGAAPGASPGEERGEDRSAAGGYVAWPRAGAICVAMASVRSVLAIGPERVVLAVKLILSQQPRRRCVERPKRAVRSNRREKGRRSVSAAPQGEFAELRTQGFRAGSSRHLLPMRLASSQMLPGKGNPGRRLFRLTPPRFSPWGWNSAPWFGIPGEARRALP